MRRRDILALVGGAAAWPLAARAQQSGRIARIGYLSGASEAIGLRNFEAFARELRRRGYVLGANLAIELRWADGRSDAIRKFVMELSSLNLDVLVTVGPHPTMEAAKINRTMPIVFVNVSIPVERGLVANLSRPGGNVTGFALDVTPETSVKGLELLKEIMPRLSVVAVLRAAVRPSGAFYWEALQTGARALGLMLDPAPVIENAQDIERAFALIRKRQPDALYVMPDPVTVQLQRQVLSRASEAKIPAIYPFRFFAEAGGLVSYGPDLNDMYARAAGHVDKIVKGSKPADLPVELPSRFELVANLKTAKALGITIPPALLARADEVIE